MLAGWFPQITCIRHEVFTTHLFTGEFHVHSITALGTTILFRVTCYIAVQYNTGLLWHITDVF